MRIAILVYGRLNYCVKHYNNILDNIGREHILEFFVSSDNSPLIDIFIEIYNPIKYNNDKIEYSCDLGKYPGRIECTKIHNMTCHFINKGRVFSLLEEHVENTHIKYDVVFSLRIDMIFHNKFDFNTIKDNTIYIPEGHDWGFGHKGLNDQLAYGNIDVMKKYSNIFINGIDLLEKGNPNYESENYIIPHPETINYVNVHSYNINIVRFPLSFEVERYEFDVENPP